MIFKLNDSYYNCDQKTPLMHCWFLNKLIVKLSPWLKCLGFNQSCLR